MSEQKFKIGDRVSIAPKYRGRYNALVGTGVVKELIKSTLTGRLLYKVQFVDKKPLFSFYSYELTKSNDEIKSMTAVDKLKKDNPIIFAEFRERDILEKEEIAAERKERWKNICNEYLKLFCHKHGYYCEPDMWIKDDPGTIVLVSDMYVNMDDIRYDIDNDIPEPYFSRWYWKSLEIYELCGEKYMNYESYCKGAPDYWTEERMAQIRESKRRIEKAREELEQTIKETAKGKLF